jgi:hypothetical protein
MRKIFALLAAVGGTFGLVLVADADTPRRGCTSAPQSQCFPIETLRSKVEALGYKIENAKLRTITTCAELYTTDKNGEAVELFVDPTSGAIVSRL